MARQSLTIATEKPASVLVTKHQNGIWETSAMWIESENALFVLSFVVQLMGIGGVLAARFNLGQGRVVLSMICFLMVGVMSLMLMRTCSGSWLVFATTMPLMAVGATLDLKKGTRAVDF